MVTFGEEVKRLADAKGLTQKALAEASGVQQSFISKLYLGKRATVKAETLFGLASALGVSCEHFRKFLTPETTTPAEPPAGVKKTTKKKK